MSGINRMDNPVCPVSLEEATLADIEVLECSVPTPPTKRVAYAMLKYRTEYRQTHVLKPC